MRAYYRNFDQLFVLNSDHHKWLTDEEMGFSPDKIKLTSHWADNDFYPRTVNKKEVYGIDENKPVILYAGRISPEKGVMDLPKLYSKISEEIRDVQFVIAGTGPAEKELKKAFPQAIFMGWVDHAKLPEIYSAADMLVLPSKFDTFSCVVLEALNCGLPVIAYKTKGPKDIIIDGETGYLVSHKKAMEKKLIEYLKDKNLRESFRKAAVERGKLYNNERISNQLFADCGF
jgi:glycosyltransferase involved in cell wall biosynthesis